MAVQFCKAMQGRKHRVHQWVDTTTLEPLFGIQVNVEYGKWAHVVEGSSPLLFPTKGEAAAKAKALSVNKDAA